jgi:hypothetical protein
MRVSSHPTPRQVSKPAEQAAQDPQVKDQQASAKDAASSTSPQPGTGVAATPINIPKPGAGGVAATPINIPKPGAGGVAATPINIPKPPTEGVSATPIHLPRPADGPDGVRPVPLPDPTQGKAATPINIPKPSQRVSVPSANPGQGVGATPINIPKPPSGVSVHQDTFEDGRGTSGVIPGLGPSAHTLPEEDEEPVQTMKARGSNIASQFRDEEEPIQTRTPNIVMGPRQRAEELEDEEVQSNKAKTHSAAPYTLMPQQAPKAEAIDPGGDGRLERPELNPGGDGSVVRPELDTGTDGRVDSPELDTGFGG